jgi:hypothetical protein
MPSPFSSKLRELGFRLPHWCDLPSESLVLDFENRFEVTLPADYREFLVHHGGVVYGNAICSFQEPTPLGKETNIEGFYGFAPPERSDNISWATKLIDGAPSVIAIGDGGLNGMIWLMCDGDDKGHVYLHDGDGRFAWDDDMFFRMYPNMHSDIKSYLELRRRRKLPVKRQGYEHMYRLGRTFTEFFDSLIPAPDDDEKPATNYDRVWKGLRACDEHVLKELIAGGKLNQPLDYGWTPMQLVAGDMRAMRWLLAAGATLDGTVGMAAQRGSVDAVRFLIEKGFDVEERVRGFTPLMKAVEVPYPEERLGEFIEVGRVLIEHGANVNAVSDDGRSVLEIAGGKRYSNGKPHGQPELIAFLESVGARLRPK